MAGAAPPDDIAFQETTWRAQRAAWWLCLAVLAVGSSGLFGAGPLARAELAHGAGSIRYEWIVRVGRETVLTFRADTVQEARVELRGRVPETLQLLGVMPPTARLRMSTDALLIVMPRDAAGTTVQLRAVPKAAGVFRASVLVDGQASGTLLFIVFP